MDFLLEEVIRLAEERAREEVNGDEEATMICPTCDPNDPTKVKPEDCVCTDGIITKFAFYTDMYMKCDCPEVFVQDEIEAKDAIGLFGYRVTVHIPLGGKCHRIIRDACEFCHAMNCDGECVPSQKSK